MLKFDKYVVKDHTSFFEGKPEVRFWSCKDPRQFSTWTKLLSRKRFKNTKVSSNHFQFGKPVDSHPHPTLFLRGYDQETEITREKSSHGKTGSTTNWEKEEEVRQL